MHPLNRISLSGLRAVESVARLGCLTISVAPLFASHWLVWRLPQFAQLHPDISLRLQPTVQMTTPGIDGIDIGLRVGGGGWPGLRLERLLDMRFFPVCAPALARDIHDLDDLLRLPVIRENKHLLGWSEWLVGHGRDTGALRDGPELADGGLCLNAAISGQGVFMAWETLVVDAVADGRLAAPLPGRATNEQAYWIATAPEAYRKPAIARFSAWLRHELPRSVAQS